MCDTPLIAYRGERLAEIVVVATTRAMLAFAEERGLIQSAEDIWNEVVKRKEGKRAEGANPRIDVQVIRPTRAP